MLSRKVTAPKPIEHWFRDPQYIERMREIVSDPIFQHACATLLAAALPSFRNADNAESNSLRHSWLAGYRDALNDLVSLTNAPNKPTSLPDEWSHYA